MSTYGSLPIHGLIALHPSSAQPLYRQLYDSLRAAILAGQLVGGARLPSTQRLDLSATRAYQWRGATIAPYLSIVNVYNAKNVFLYVFDYGRTPPTRESVSQFPFLPSAGVSIAF